MYTDEDFKLIEAKATEMQFDGCTGVPDFYLACCNHHDLMYRTGKDIHGKEVSRAYADKAFRQCIQSRSTYGKLSPMSWWRWLAVRLFGGSAWNPK